MTLDRTDGLPIGRHLLIVRLLKGCYNQNPPQPKYSALWNVETVFCFKRPSIDNLSLNLPCLTQKQATLLAISRFLDYYEPQHNTHIFNYCLKQTNSGKIYIHFSCIRENSLKDLNFRDYRQSLIDSAWPEVQFNQESTSGFNLCGGRLRVTSIPVPVNRPDHSKLKMTRNPP